jgi:23S rRNA pseudouridine1911/1915/1917 synthase
VGRLPWNREHFGVLPEGREAITTYEVINVYKKDKEFYSLVRAFPKTGRTHQIRVHFKYINHPLVADMLYAGRKTNRQDRQFAPRVMLHAAELTLTHPITGLAMTIDAPLPQDFTSVLSSLTQL